MGPDGATGDVLKLGGVAMFLYLAPLLDVTINNAAIPSDRKRAILLPINKGEIDL